MDMNGKLICFLSLLPLLAGCLGSAPQAPVNWTIETEATSVTRATAAKFGVVRVSQVVVRAPYDGVRLAVLRRDGSIAFDPFNAFASTPSLLLKGAACDVVAGSGLFSGVLAAGSSASAANSLEITVTRLALDCKVDGARNAVVEVSAVLLAGREIVAVVKGAGSMPSGDGNYSAAFSSAFTKALSEALQKL